MAPKPRRTVTDESGAPGDPRRSGSSIAIHPAAADEGKPRPREGPKRDERPSKFDPRVQNLSVPKDTNIYDPTSERLSAFDYSSSQPKKTEGPESKSKLAAKPTPQPVPKPTQQQPPKPAPQPTPRPTQQLAPKSTSQPALWPTPQLVPKSTQQQSPKPVSQSATRPTQQLAPESTSRSASRPPPQPTAQPASNSRLSDLLNRLSDLVKDLLKPDLEDYKECERYCSRNPAIWSQDVQELRDLAVECIHQDKNELARRCAERLLMMMVAQQRKLTADQANLFLKSLSANDDLFQTQLQNLLDNLSQENPNTTVIGSPPGGHPPQPSSNSNKPRQTTRQASAVETKPALPPGIQSERRSGQTFQQRTQQYPHNTEIPNRVPRPSSQARDDTDTIGQSSGSYPPQPSSISNNLGQTIRRVSTAETNTTLPPGIQSERRSGQTFQQRTQHHTHNAEIPHRTPRPPSQSQVSHTSHALVAAPEIVAPEEEDASDIYPGADTVDEFSLAEPLRRERGITDRTKGVGPILNLISGNNEGKNNLDASYKVRIGREAELFFVKGRVFAMVWHENAGVSAKPNSTETSAPLDSPFNRYTRNEDGVTIFSHIRRFVIVKAKPKRRYCVAIPINSYRGRGLTDKRMQMDEKQAHTIIYGNGSKPAYMAGEVKLDKQPIAVDMEEGEVLTPSSRLHFGKMQSIDWNVRMKNIGRINDPKHVRRLTTYFNSELRRGEDTGTEAEGESSH